MRIVAIIEPDDLQDMLLASRPIRRRDESLDVEAIRTHQQMHHRLKVIRIRPADIRTHNDPPARLDRCAPRLFGITPCRATTEPQQRRRQYSIRLHRRSYDTSSVPKPDSRSGREIRRNRPETDLRRTVCRFGPIA